MPNVGAKGLTPARRWAREANDDSERLAGQVPCRRRSRSSEGLGRSYWLYGRNDSAKLLGQCEKALREHAWRLSAKQRVTERPNV